MSPALRKWGEWEYIGVFQWKAGSQDISRLLLIKKTRNPKLRNLALFYVWEDAKIWAPWNHSFDMHSVISVSCVFTSWASSGITLQSGCSLVADRWEIFFVSFPSSLRAHRLTLGGGYMAAILMIMISFVYFVSTCVSLDNSFPSVRQEPILGTWKGFPFCNNIAEILSNLPKVIFVCLVAHSCPALCNPLDCSLPGSSVHGISLGKNTGVDCHTLLQGIFLTWESNWGLLHCRQILYQLSYQGSPKVIFSENQWKFSENAAIQSQAVWDSNV